MSKPNRFLIACGFIGPITFITALIVVSLLFPDYNHIRDYISELGAVDSPVQFLANTSVFFLMGICMTLFSIGLYRTIGIDWSGKLASALLFISGFTFTLIAFFPCDAACYNSSFTARIHEITSDGSLYIGGITLLFLAIHSHKQLTFKRHWAYIFLFAAIVAGLLGYIYPELDDTSYGGLVQRLAILIPFTVMAAAAYQLFRLNLPPQSQSTNKLLPLILAILIAITIFGLLSYHEFFVFAQHSEYQLNSQPNNGDHQPGSQSNNHSRSNQPPEATEVIFDQDGIVVTFYWLQAHQFISNEEAEVQIQNNNQDTIEITQPSLTFSTPTNTYNPASEGWESYASQTSHDYIDRVIIYKSIPESSLTLEPSQFGKLHYHYLFNDHFAQSVEQIAHISMNLNINGKVHAIDQTLNRQVEPQQHFQSGAEHPDEDQINKYGSGPGH